MDIILIEYKFSSFQSAKVACPSHEFIVFIEDRQKAKPVVTSIKYIYFLFIHLTKIVYKNKNNKQYYRDNFNNQYIA